ncbi:hypothetical protein [Desulfogranum mediterraneum]|uniref:hypothetical protein n=1 Tax=Desulfogranum mediterraneum TaxID=160661 RepID=UPI0004257A08|nr:hypothetical protein [Desulfogranum mediterraneum]
MIHVVWGLFFLVISMVLILCYLLAAIACSWLVASTVFLVYSFLAALAKGMATNETPPVDWKRPLHWLKMMRVKLFNRRVVKLFLLGFLAFVLMLYLNQRRQWMGPENAYHTAKEYYVAGQPLYAARKFLCLFSRTPGFWRMNTLQRWLLMGPGHPVMMPLNTLQRWIYDKGVEHIPKSDGEWAVWEQGWFLYPYVRKQSIAWDCDRDNPSPGMTILLDETWETLEAMATLTYADPEMQLQYLKNFPALAFYYYFLHGYYAPKKSGSFFDLINKPLHTARSHTMVRWLQELEDKWQADASIHDEIHKRPLIELARQETLLNGALHMALVDVIRQGEFRCDHPYVLLYRQARQEFVGSKGSPSPLMRLGRGKQYQSHYDLIINTIRGRFHNRVFRWYCGIEMAGEERFEIVNNQKWIEVEDRHVRSIYHKELQLIEENLHGHR